MECVGVSLLRGAYSLVSAREVSAGDHRRSNSMSILHPSGAILDRKSKAIGKHRPSFKPLAISRSVTVAGSPVLTEDPSPDLLKFVEAAKKGNLIPLHRCIFSDHLTPVLAYRCLVKEDDREAPSFLFESVEQGPKSTNVGRFSIVGAQPALEIVTKENLVTIMDHAQGTRKEEFVDDPLAVPSRIMSDWKPMLFEELPATFCGGWVGCFSYDTVRYVEKRKLPFSKAPKDDRGLPDMHLGLYDDVIVFDHVEKVHNLLCSLDLCSSMVVQVVRKYVF